MDRSIETLAQLILGERVTFNGSQRTQCGEMSATRYQLLVESGDVDLEDLQKLAVLYGVKNISVSATDDGGLYLEFGR